MIIFDTETTGLVMPELVPLIEQPQIIEFAAIKLDDFTLEQTESVQFLVNPGCKLPEEIIKITGISDDMLVNQPPFAAMYHTLCQFFIGENLMVAHNLDFDKSLLKFELMRIGKEFSFPWPPKQVCTVEASFGINNKRMKLSELHMHCTGQDFKGAHRAWEDTKALCTCVRYLVEQGMM